jgi:hypothetical protein
MRIGLKFITSALAAGAAALAIASAPTAAAFQACAGNGSDATCQSGGSVNGYYPGYYPYFGNGFGSYGHGGGFGGFGGGHR